MRSRGFSEDLFFLIHTSAQNTPYPNRSWHTTVSMHRIRNQCRPSHPVGGNPSRLLLLGFPVSPTFYGGACLLSVTTLPSSPQRSAATNNGLVDRRMPGNRTRFAILRVRRLGHYTKRNQPYFGGVYKIIRNLIIENWLPSGESSIGTSLSFAIYTRSNT